MSIGGGFSDTLSQSQDTTTTDIHTGQTTTLQGPGDQELALRDLNFRLAGEQSESILGSQNFQDFLNSQIFDLFSPDALARTEERASQAGQLTDQEDALISQAFEEGLGFGESEIDRFTKEGLGFLKQEVAPSRGLRFADTPILDRGGEIVSEGIRQKSQLLRGLKGQAAQSRLNFPLQRQRFQESLRDNARRARMGFAGTVGGLGLGNASINDPMALLRVLFAERAAQPKTAGTETGKRRTRSFGHTNTQSGNAAFDFGGFAGG